VARYDAYLSSPISVSIRLLEPVQLSIPTTEQRVPGDPFTADVKDHPGWVAYSASGEAEGQLIYAHFGSQTDFAKLQALGVDVRGKILLMRYLGWDGRKVRNAERFGAAGVIFYSDPQQDGYHYGDVYPKGDWRPPGGIERSDAIDLPYPGDALSPGWASVPGAKRLRPEDVPLPRIPVLAISYGSARQLLGYLGGNVAPYDWQGDLPLTYKTGPGPARVRIQTKMNNGDRPIWNVIGRLPGKTAPDQWVIVSNHHDAWVFGAGDPSSGTAALLELSRDLGQMAREGHSFRRTVVVAFWDAEEMPTIGSTEWVEQHMEELLDKAVACINMDSAVFNPDRPLSVSAHPVLHELFREASRSIPDPKTGKSTFEVWRDAQNTFRHTPTEDGWDEFFNPEAELSEPYVFAIPSDDADAFFDYLALPASDMYYGADYGVYHSIYDNFHWMKTVADPQFRYHAVMAQLQGLVVARLANADLLPLDFATEAGFWRRSYQGLDKSSHEKGQQVPKLREALDLIDQWEMEAKGLAQDEIELLSDPARREAAQSHLMELNQMIYKAPRNFYRPKGRADSPEQRNLFFGTSYDFQGVSGTSLPGIRFALDQGKVQEAEREADVYLEALRLRVATLRSIRQSIANIR